MEKSEIERYIFSCFRKPWRLKSEIYKRDDEDSTMVFEIICEDQRERLSALKVIPVREKNKFKALQEVELMKRLGGYKNIVSIEESASVNANNEHGKNYLFIRMELLTSLATLIDEDELAENEVITAAIDICEALEECHKQNIAHRDIKPENVFVSSEGVYKLGDFGISKIFKDGVSVTQTSRNEYTPMYAAPEILRAYDVNYLLSDIYSLGLVLYKLLNNNILPFGPCSQDDILKKRISEKDIPEPKFCCKELASIVWKALQYEPENRYQSVADMKKDLLTLVEGTSSGKNNAYSQWLCKAGKDAYNAQQYDDAFKFFLESKNLGYNKASHYIGICLYHGFGTEQDHDAAINLLIPSADEGDCDAAFCVGSYYYSQTIKKTDYQKAVKYFKVAAEKGNAEAQFKLGYCYLKGYVEKNEAEAEQWFTKAAAQGHLAAQTYIKQEDYWHYFDWIYINNDSEVRITKCKHPEFVGAINIPDSIDGKPVTALSESMFLEYTPDCTEKEDDSAAAVLKLLIQEDENEKHCEDLKSMYIPANINQIDEGVFCGCVNLSCITVSPENKRYYAEDDVLFDNKKNALVFYPAGKTTEKYTVPNGIAAISNRAFENSTGLKEIVLPVSLTEIGTKAFAGCKALSVLEIPEGVTEVKSEAFIYCCKLKKVTFPKSVRKIGAHILSRRYGAKIMSFSNTFAEIYAREQYYDFERINKITITPELSEQIEEALLYLLVAYVRHPDGVPLISNSYRLVMHAGINLLRAGGKELLEYSVDLLCELSTELFQPQERVLIKKDILSHLSYFKMEA